MTWWRDERPPVDAVDAGIRDGWVLIVDAGTVDGLTSAIRTEARYIWRPWNEALRRCLARADGRERCDEDY